MRCCCVVRQFRTDGATCDEHLTSELDILAGRHSVSASLGAVTSRRIKDEVNAARKVELVISSSLTLVSSVYRHVCDATDFRLFQSGGGVRQVRAEDSSPGQDRRAEGRERGGVLGAG